MPAFSSWALGTLAATTLGGGVASAIGQTNAANAQERGAMEQLQYALETRNLAMDAAAPTANELALQDAQMSYMADYLDRSQSFLDRQVALADVIDPTIRESATQAYQLLQGQDAKVLDPIKRQQEQERQDLQQQLRDQFGSGYGGTSAAQNAMARLNQGQEVTRAQVQDQALGRLLGTTMAARPDLMGELGRQAGTYGALTSNAQAGMNALSGRMVNAITGNQVAPYGGAQYIGEAGAGNALAGFGGMLSGLSGGILGLELGARANGRQGLFRSS